jgi:hypothetical protein
MAVALAEMPEPTLADVPDHVLNMWVERADERETYEGQLERLVELQRTISHLSLSFATTAANLVSAACDVSSIDAEAAFDEIWNACRISKYVLRDRLCVGNQVSKMPRAEDAFYEGKFGFQHLSALAHTAEQVSEGRFNESMFLRKAVDPNVGVGDFVSECKKIRHRLDKEGVAKEEQNTAELNRLEVKADGEGCYTIDSWLDPIGGGIVKAALDSLAKPSGADDDRPREKRLADALVELAAVGAKVDLNVTATVETVENQPGCDAGHLEHAGLISSQAVQQFICGDTSWRRVLFSTDSVVIDAGRSKRVVSPAMEAAMHARDKGCRWPGCHRPSSHCQGHHVVPWSKNGETSLDKLLSLCWRHHGKVHAGWQLIPDETGTLIAIRPRDC